MKVNGKEYSVSEIFKLVQTGMKWQKDSLIQKNDRHSIVRKWLEDSSISMGPFKVKGVACHGHYLKWCEENSIDPKLRLNIVEMGKFLSSKFSYKQHGSTRLYELNQDFSTYEKKAKKDEDK